LVYPLGSDETGDEMQMISCSLKGNLLTDQGTGVIAFPEEKVSPDRTGLDWLVLHIFPNSGYTR
jgi:hypothetical protein